MTTAGTATNDATSTVHGPTHPLRHYPRDRPCEDQASQVDGYIDISPSRAVASTVAERIGLRGQTPDGDVPKARTTKKEAVAARVSRIGQTTGEKVEATNVAATPAAAIHDTVGPGSRRALTIHWAAQAPRNHW